MGDDFTQPHSAALPPIPDVPADFYPCDGHGRPWTGEWVECPHCSQAAWRWYEPTFMNTFKCPNCGAYAPGNVGEVNFRHYVLPGDVKKMAQELLPGQYQRINCPHLEGKSGLGDVAMAVHLDEHHVLMVCPECKMIITGHILKEIVEQAVVPQLKSAIDKAFSRP